MGDIIKTGVEITPHCKRKKKYTFVKIYGRKFRIRPKQNVIVEYHTCLNL